MERVTVGLNSDAFQRPVQKMKRRIRRPRRRQRERIRFVRHVKHMLQEPSISKKKKTKAYSVSTHLHMHDSGGDKGYVWLSFHFRTF